MKIIEEEVFDATNTLEPGQYELCTFRNSDFSKYSFSEYKFIECEFESCDLSLINVTYTAFQDVQFNACKLLGIHWDTCNEFLFSVNFNNCKLDNSSFYQCRIEQISFLNSSLQGVDFTEANLTKADFSQTDLLDANFEGANLTQSNFKTARNFAINGDLTKLYKTKFSKDNLEGLLRHLNVEITN